MPPTDSIGGNYRTPVTTPGRVYKHLLNTHALLRSSRRATPYTVRRLDSSHFVKPPTAKQLQQLKGLINKTWRCYRASPLYQFNLARFRDYSKALSAHLLAESRSGMAVTSDQAGETAKFSIVHSLASRHERTPAVKIEVWKTDKQGKPVARPSLTLLFCCLTDSLPTIHQDFILMPLVLVQGPVMLARSLIEWLQKEFDCAISPLAFSPLSLSWMVGMWAEYRQGMKPRPVELKYAPPSSIKGINYLTLSINAHDSHKLWDSVHEEKSRYFTEKEVQAFQEALEGHFYHLFHIYLAAMKLCRVGTSTALVSSEGKLKIYDVRALPTILGHLTSIAMEQ